MSEYQDNVVFIQQAPAARKAVEALAGQVISFDTETTGLNVRSGEQDIGRTIQFSMRPWAGAIVMEMVDEMKPFIDEILWSAEEVIAHNIKFDVHVAETFLGYSLFQVYDYEKLHDTVWSAAFVDERDGKKLKELAVRHLNDKAAGSQAALKRFMKDNGFDWATVPVEQLIVYGGNDAIITGQLFDLLHPKAMAIAPEAYTREQHLAPVLYAMERAGMLLDVPLLEQVAKEEEAARDAALLQVRTMYPGLNPNSHVQVRKAFEERGMEIPDTQAPTLRKAYAAGEDLAGAILKFRKHGKTFGTYCKPWLEVVTSKGRIHPSINSLGAKTGRMSSEKPNFQNIPRGHRLRDIILAEEGSTMLVADWNQMELRLYAHFARDEAMRAAFLDGHDIYQEVADTLGVERQVGKMMMLASIYGAGPTTIKRQAINMAYALGMEDLIPTLRDYDWQDLHERFHAKYNIKNLSDQCELQARRRGALGEPYIMTTGGRRQRPKRVKLKPVNGYRQTVFIFKDLANSLVQGSSADMMKQALIETAEAGYLQYMRLTVHDEQVLEVPLELVDEVSETLDRLMTRREFVPPLTIGADSAQRYGQAK